MSKAILSAAVLLVFISAGCVTNSKVVTDPPGMAVSLNGKEFGSSPCDIQSTGTTFGEYRLQLKDSKGDVAFEQNLAKNVRIWGIFWPPYGVLYNLYEMFPQYTVRQLKLSTGETTWAVTTN